MDNQSNNPDIVLSMDTTDIENLDIEKLKELYLKASYVLSFSLCRSVGSTNKRLEYLGSFLRELENNLCETDFNSLSFDERLRLYNTMMSSSSKSFDTMLKLNQSMASNIDSISKIEENKFKREKRRVNRKDPVVEKLIKDVQKEIDLRKNKIIDVDS